MYSTNLVTSIMKKKPLNSDGQQSHQY